MQRVFSVLEIKPGDSDRGHIGVYWFWTTQKAKQDVRRSVVAQENSQSQKFPQGHIDVCFRVFVL